VVEAQPAQASGRRIVVVSPHLDDGALSLGAAMAGWSRTGARVELLTVLGCDPDSEAPAGGWDGRAGYRTEGDSARGRREEDRRACALLGVTPVWLPFGSVDYERHGDEQDVRGAVADAVAGADAALVPGFPLSHPDHEWLVRTLAEGRFGCRRLGLYAEQPYAHRAGRGTEAPEWVAVALGGRASFSPLRASARDRLAKWRAIREYRSQLPLLGMRRSLRRGAHTLALHAEWVAWADH
jgi:LmbE family N-acetylglucosaminyl deacetylase